MGKNIYENVLQHVDCETAVNCNAIPFVNLDEYVILFLLWPRILISLLGPDERLCIKNHI